MSHLGQAVGGREIEVRCRRWIAVQADVEDEDEKEHYARRP